MTLYGKIMADYDQWRKESMDVCFDDYKYGNCKLRKTYPVGNFSLEVYGSNGRLGIMFIANINGMKVSVQENKEYDFDKVWKKFKRNLEKSRKESVEYEKAFEKSGRELPEFAKGKVEDLGEFIRIISEYN